MKKIYIIANWKSNKTIYQADRWFRTFNNSQLTINKEEKEVIICPSFTLLSFVKESIVKSQLSIAVGAQDISPFDEGAYTGEVNGKQIKEFAEYVIIGHSERRNYFREGEEIVNKKISLAYKYRITPIICVSNISQIHDSSSIILNSNCIVVYEPVFAIGTGNSDTPENAERIAKQVKANTGVLFVLYGGSVTSKNVKEFTKMSNIDGILVGGASLDAQEFYTIIQNA